MDRANCCIVNDFTLFAVQGYQLLYALPVIEFLYHAQHSIVTHALHLAILYMGLAVATVFVACQSTDY